MTPLRRGRTRANLGPRGLSAKGANSRCRVRPAGKESAMTPALALALLLILAAPAWATEDDPDLVFFGAGWFRLWSAPVEIPPGEAVVLRIPLYDLDLDGVPSAAVKILAGIGDKAQLMLGTVGFMPVNQPGLDAYVTVVVRSFGAEPVTVKVKLIGRGRRAEE